MMVWIRRHRVEPWTLWCDAESAAEARRQANLIEFAGWEWSCAELGRDLRELTVPRVEEKRRRRKSRRRGVSGR